MNRKCLSCKYAKSSSEDRIDMGTYVLRGGNMNGVKCTAPSPRFEFIKGDIDCVTFKLKEELKN